MADKMNLKRFYMIACIIGTIVPWVFFTYFLLENGIDIQKFIVGLFANGAAGGFSADIMISIGVFWVWAYFDAKQKTIKQWWLILPAGCFVGLSLALPLYFYLRCRQLETI
jgi:hypothetical protein